MMDNNKPAGEGSEPLQYGPQSCVWRRLHIPCAVLMAACLMLFAACDRHDSEQIQWQLPLTPPEDPHGAQQGQALPEWAASRQGRARFLLLETGTARTFDIEVKSGGEAEKQAVDVRLLGLTQHLRLRSGTYIEDENVHNPAAYVEVSEKGVLIYRGWLYQEFPELFGPDSPHWKLWLKQVEVQPRPEDVEDAPQPGARSSAG